MATGDRNRNYRVIGGRAGQQTIERGGERP
jgi:hypothetical protein